jgi:hypothetical protein
MPAPEDMPASAASPCYLWSNDVQLLSKAYQNILKRLPDQGGVQQFGCYLFDTLIGDMIWKEMQKMAEDAHAENIELALCWSPSEKDLHRLNWEMMHSGENFLAAGKGKAPICITRLVASNPSPEEPRQMARPPRLLFVVGTSLTDPKIRPGAEYLGLLRQLKRQGRRVYSRVLENASPKRIKQAMASFKPDVVYFICHGNIDRVSNRGYLELTKDEQETDPRRFGDQLVEYLRVDGANPPYPPIVVMSACYSASTPQGTETVNMMGAHQTGSLVAELIHGGIPIVLGMAGRVSDLACRLFTRRFGEALVQGESLITATAEARRATFAEGAPPQRSVDWAFPAVFMAANVDPGYVPVRVREGEIDPAEQVEGWIRSYDVERMPVFCGRDEFFQAYYDFFSPGGKLVLAASVEDPGSGFGKTRLLHELTIQALLDGHVPCLVSAERINQGWEAPTSAMELGVAILNAIHKARIIFKLETPKDSQLFLLKMQKFDDPKLNEDIKFKINLAEGIITTEIVKLALQMDLSKLARDAREKVPAIQQAKGQVLVLLDAVEKYCKALDNLLNEMLGPYGLGSVDESVPVVLAFSQSGSVYQILRPNLDSKPWLKLLPLQAFRNDGEDMLAYGWLILHPFKPTLLPGVSNVPLVVRDDAGEDLESLYQDLIRAALKGIPGVFAEGTWLYMISKNALEHGYLMEADDEAFLKKMREREQIR